MKSNPFSFLLAGLAGLSSIFSVRGDVRTYPEYPAGIERDYAYAVRVCQGEVKSPLVVYNHCEKSIARAITSCSAKWGPGRTSILRASGLGRAMPVQDLR